jgi:hypothetical protein
MTKFTGRLTRHGLPTLSVLVIFAASARAELPDLIINRSRLASSIEIKEQFFSASDCAIIEGCLRSPGNRRLLLFEVAFVNIGKDDLVIGSPHDNPQLFEYSPCHGHHHLSDAASYDLVRTDGSSVLVGRKQAFCLRDNAPYSTSAGPSSGYDCDNQGITAGWEDIYPKTLDCQWLDITGIAGGTYTLRITVNPVRAFEESTYGNNSASVTILIPGGPAPPPQPPSVTPPTTPTTPTYIRRTASRPTPAPAPRSTYIRRTASQSQSRSTPAPRSSYIRTTATRLAPAPAPPPPPQRDDDDDDD